MFLSAPSQRGRRGRDNCPGYRFSTSSLMAVAIQSHRRGGYRYCASGSKRTQLAEHCRAEASLVRQKRQWSALAKTVTCRPLRASAIATHVTDGRDSAAGRFRVLLPNVNIALRPELAALNGLCGKTHLGDRKRTATSRRQTRPMRGAASPPGPSGWLDGLGPQDPRSPFAWTRPRSGR